MTDELVGQRLSPPTRRPVTLHPGPREAIEPAMAALGAVFDMSRAVLGGGTALEAKWHHRRSTDLDLFMETETNTLAGACKIEPDKVGATLTQMPGVTEVQQSRRSFLSMVVNGTPVSLAVVGPFFVEDAEPCCEASTGIPLAPNADILIRKLQGRLALSGQAVPRDAYDIVVAQHVDFPSFRDAYAHLDDAQIDTVKAILAARIETPPVTAGRAVDSPAYPQLLDDLWRHAYRAVDEPTPQAIPLRRAVDSTNRGPDRGR